MCNEEEAYLYSIYQGYDFHAFHAIYRSKMDGSDSPNHNGPILRLPINNDFPFNGFAFAVVGSRFYMIPVGDMPHISKDVFVVETRNIVDNATNDDRTIMRRVPSVLHSPTIHPNLTIEERGLVLCRQAVAIDGKVYIYSSDFSSFSVSGFEVFDPLTETCTALPEPPVELYKCTGCLAAFGTKLILCETDLNPRPHWESRECTYKSLSNKYKIMYL